MEQLFQQKDDVLFVSHSSLTWKSLQRRFRVDRPFYRMLLVFQGVKFETGNVRYMMARQIFSQLCCIIYKRNTVYNISDIKHCSNDENRVHCKISKDTCAFL